MQTLVKRIKDFELNGLGSADPWAKTDWLPLVKVDGHASYTSRAKVLYSKSGLYFLFDCEDRKLSCTLTEYGSDIYTEDVVELFLWPDECVPLYFEYEISPLGVELPILVPNCDGVFHGWLPWHYDGNRKIRNAVSVRGGPQKPMADIEGWMAEIFIPFALLKALRNSPPTSGSTWRANLYRIDYDKPKASHWAWCPDIGHNFHNYQEFGTFLFE